MTAHDADNAEAPPVNLNNDRREPPMIDVDQPNAARVYNFYLGGTANFAADRQAARAAAHPFPGGFDGVRRTGRQNRAFLGRAVHYLAGQGVRQFLDLGTGIPHDDNVQAVARAAAPDARVVCVDYDPVVLAHAHRLSHSPDGGAAFLHGDFRDVEGVLTGAARGLDLDQPVAVMLVALLHLFTDEDSPYELVRRYMNAVPAGSWLVATHLTDDLTPMAETARILTEAMTEPMVLRPAHQVARFFDGLDLADPGVVPVTHWRPDSPPDGGTVVVHYAGIARKP